VVRLKSIFNGISINKTSCAAFDEHEKIKMILLTLENTSGGKLLTSALPVIQSWPWSQRGILLWILILSLVIVRKLHYQ